MKVIGFVVDEGKTLVWNRLVRNIVSQRWVITVKADMEMVR